MADAFTKITELINTLGDEEKFLVAAKLIPIIHSIGFKKDIKLFDNYNYRTYLMADKVRQGVWEDLKVSSKRTGKDASSEKYKLEDIEFKSSGAPDGKNPLKTSFAWDKQEDPPRREKTLSSNAYVFARFEQESLKIILVGHDSSAVTHIQSIMKPKQQQFLEAWNKNRSNNKRGFDGIRINFDELLQGETKWDIYVNNEWKKNINASECRELIEKNKEVTVKKPRKKKSTNV